jgi:hypothetical protein
VQGSFDWESVVVKGPFSPQHSAFAGWNYDQAVAALRRLIPGTLTDDDPTPHRNVVFAIHASEIFGRRSTSTAPAIRADRSPTMRGRAFSPPLAATGSEG